MVTVGDPQPDADGISPTADSCPTMDSATAPILAVDATWETIIPIVVTSIVDSVVADVPKGHQELYLVAMLVNFGKDQSHIRDYYRQLV